MKLNLFRWAAIALLAAIPLVATPQYAIVLDEDFEECADGTLPFGWTLEYVTDTRQNWAVESGGDYPAGAYAGSNKRVALRNSTDMTIGFVTRLVTPPMDLSTLNLPVLCFAHAQAQWTNDFDILRVYYRTSPDKGWTPLPMADYSNTYIPQWRMDTVELSSTLGQRAYQLAFEGTDRLGRGIVLDNIVVRSKPTCLQPTNLFISDQQNTSVTLNYSSGIDSESFRIVISRTELTPEELEGTPSDGIAIDTTATVENVSITGLEPNSSYFAYVKAHCATEESTWSQALPFSTASTDTVPYRETFDVEHSYTLQARRNTWTYYNSNEEFSPYINAKTTTYDLKNYSRDKTTGLFFTSESSTVQPIPAGQRAYTVTPRLEVTDISECQVSFYGTYYDAGLSRYSRRLIVGVMEIPDDYSTFTPVDTVELTAYKVFQDFVVPLTRYADSGKQGKYIALVSDFKEANIFYLDDFRVDYISTCAYPYDIRISMPSATKMTVTWDSYGAAKGDIVLSEKEIDTAAIDLSSPDLIVKQDADLSAPVTMEVKPQTTYWLCVRNRCTAPGAWSIPMKLRTPGVVASIPDTISFEDEETYKPKDGANKYLPPVLLTYDDMSDNMSNRCKDTYSSSPYSGDGYLPFRSPYVMELVATPSCQSVVVLPSAEGQKDYRVSFWYGSYRKDYIGATFEVGTMTDAASAAGFKPIASFTTGDVWQKASIEMDKYPDAGFLAFRISSPEGQENNSYAYIDDIIFEPVPSCGDPTDISITPGEITANATWNANGATAWDIRVTDTEVHIDSLSSGTFAGVIFSADGISENSVEITNLQAESTDYYFYIRSACDGGSWYGAIKFTTECQAECRMPYTLNFDRFPDGDFEVFAVPCVYSKTHVGSTEWTFWPKLTNSSSYSYHGNSLQFNSPYGDMYDNYLALPPMAEKLSELEFSMYVYAHNTSHIMAIGVMTDPEDLSTFDTVMEFRPEQSGVHEEVIAHFSNYKGSGRHIAIRTDGAFNVDEISVNVKGTCAKVQKPKMRSVTDVSAVIGWTGDVETKWDLLISPTPVERDRLSSLFASPVEGMKAETVESNPCTVTGLSPNKEYYVYVRANCGTSGYGEWANDCAHFATECVPVDAEQENIESFDSYGHGKGSAPGCWTVANNSKTDEDFIPYCSDEYHHNGAASLRFHSAADNDAYAIMPRIETDDIRLLQVSFWGSCAANALPKYENRLIVGIASSANDWGTFVPVDTIEGYAEEQLYTVRFSSYRGAVDGSLGQYIAFRSYFSKENFFYIDDVTVSVTPDCPSPLSISVDGISDNSVSISWSGGTAPYTVLVSDVSLTREQLSDLKSLEGEKGVHTATTSEMKTTVGSLNANTTYYMYIRSECAGTPGEWSNVIRFKTDCTHDIAMPFVEDFSSNTASGEAVNPNCWTSYFNGMEENPTYPSIDSGGRTGVSVRLQTDKQTDSILLISPQLPVDDLSDCQVTFYAHPGSASCGVIVGIVSDASDEQTAWKTFTPVDTVTVKSSWSKCTVPFTGFEGKGNMVAFSTAYSLNSQDVNMNRYVKIDDIDIEVIPTCPRPDLLTLTGRSDSEISVSFSELGSAARWQLQYGQKGFEAGSGTTVELTSTAHTLTGLAADTEYDIYVRSLCSDDDMSRWHGPLTVTTTPVAIVGGQSSIIDFEDEDDNSEWLFANEGQVNQWHIGNAYKKDGERALYISNDGGVTAEYSTNVSTSVWAYRYISLEQGIYTFSYDWICYGDGNGDYMKVILVPSTATVRAGSSYIYYADGTSDYLSAFSDNYKQGYSLNSVDRTALHQEEEWQHATRSLIVTGEMTGTYMLLVEFNTNSSGGNIPNPSAVIDNISIDYNPCLYPDSLSLSSFTDKGATLSWTALGTPDHYEIVATDTLASPDVLDETHITDCGTAQGTSAVIDKLSPGLQYWIYMRAVCGEDSKSPWTEALALRTECSLYETGYVFTFDDGASYTPEYKDIDVPVCFVSYHEKHGSSGYFSGYPVLKYSDGRFATYSRSGDYAVEIDAGSSSSFGGYLVMPKIDGNLDTMQLTFYMRPTYYSVNGGGMMGISKARDGRTITIGTMTDPYDLSTFVKIRDVVYPWDEYPEVDPNNDNYWYRASVQLTGGTDRYIVFKCDKYDALENSMYIDDICVESTRGCVMPTNLTVDSIGDVAARLSFSHSDGDEWEVHISSDVAMGDTLWLDTVRTGTAVMQNLIPNAATYARVRQICGDGEYSDWSQVKEFRTAHTLRFLEEFEERIRVPESWLFTTTANVFSLDEVYSGKHKFEYSQYAYEKKDGWTYSDVEAGLPGNHMMCKSVSSFFLLTPEIHINDMRHAHLTFDLALTKGGSSEAIDIAERGDSSAMFMVMVSDDSGATWKEGNTFTWNNLGTGDFVFDDIPASGDSYRLDLSAYSGKTVKIALYACYGRANTEIDLHLDNFRLSNFYVSSVSDNLCETQDYFANGFSILGKDIADGNNDFERMVYVKEDIPDTLYSLSISTMPMAERLIEASVCEGDTYTLDGFSASTQGIHKRKHHSANGCDSVTVLDLTVVEIPEIIEFDTICQGQNVVWHGKEYNRTGTYTDTLQMTGGCRCDSIVTLALHVTGAQTEAEKITICHGDSIEIGELGFIRESGLWRDTISTPSGCDSIIEVDLTVLPELVTVIDTAICLGEEYNDGNFIGMDETGTETITIESSNKCDSTLILNLIVLNPYSPVQVERSVTREQLPFEFYGLTFDENTADGVYTEKVTVTTPNCSGEVELTLHVGETVNINRVSSGSGMLITPNPVSVGGTVTFGVGLAASERSGATINVYNSTGALVRTEAVPEEGDITMACYFSPGVYIARLTDSAGRTYQGKFIVR